MENVLALLLSLAGLAALILLPWAICWGSFWWTRLRCARAEEETIGAQVVLLQDAMPYLHNRWGGQREPLLPFSWYYATFKAEGRAPMRFRISREAYYGVSQGSRGQLTFRGRLFIRFEPARPTEKPIFTDHE